MSRRITSVVFAVPLLLAGFAASAQTPPRNVSAHRHPNLAAAQRLVDRAYQRVVDAQRANEFDLDGHAAHAKALLEQADAELKAAAQASNQNHR
ncbi:MAG TPA: hypothetical protein VJ722_04500 [Rhodanobacteraceae bacterium]|nr:MAG: hypothetical protein OJF61_002440 [Rhodanobacteraceae bacterium]HJU25915.1 hypothetical protein [Rhodanobacteraceae bacterium]